MVYKLTHHFDYNSFEMASQLSSLTIKTLMYFYVIGYQYHLELN